jgi:hypothetical protein
MWVLVVLAILTVIIGLITFQSVSSFRQAEHRHYQLQALWLARSGVERAVARLLTDPVDYTGESLELIPRSQVRIEVTKEGGKSQAFRITCEARYPADQSEQVLRSQTRRFRRIIEKERVRLELMSGETPANKSGE